MMDPRPARLDEGSPVGWFTMEAVYDRGYSFLRSFNKKNT